jgi:hypothetical protein
LLVLCQIRFRSTTEKSGKRKSYERPAAALQCSGVSGVWTQEHKIF